MKSAVSWKTYFHFCFVSYPDDDELLDEELDDDSDCDDGLDNDCDDGEDCDDGD